MRRGLEDYARAGWFSRPKLDDAHHRCRAPVGKRGRRQGAAGLENMKWSSVKVLRNPA